MSEGYSKLDPISQAWILSVMRPGAAAEGILAMARVPYERWLRFVLPFMIKMWILGAIALVVAVFIDYS